MQQRVEQGRFRQFVMQPRIGAFDEAFRTGSRGAKCSKTARLRCCSIPPASQAPLK
jgi:hypothetical protein